VTGFYDLTPGRLCVHCSVELSRYRKTFCSNACREATPRAFVGNPKGRPARVGTVTDEFRTKLCGLWADGIVTAQIGLQLGVTKNSVIGFAHRWNLVPRSSPIIRTGPTKPRALAAPRKPPSPKSPPRVVPPHPPAASRLPEILPPAARTPNPPTPRPVAFSAPKTCQWIEPDCDGPPWLMCGVPTVEHGPWCAEHRRRCWASNPRALAA
jgi:GcrA cell cycle regulator